LNAHTIMDMSNIMGKKVFVAGDSFSYGSELSDIHNVWWRNVWPNAYSITMPGASNDYILRNLRYFLNTQRHQQSSVDFVAIMWTFPTRFEFCFDKDIDTGRFSQWHTIGTKKEPEEIQHFTHTFNKYVGTNILHQQHNAWMNISYAEMLLQKYEIDYMFTHADWDLFGKNGEYTNIDMTRWYMPDPSDKKGFLNWAIDKGYKRGPDGHPLDQAHIDFAKDVYEWLG